MNTMKIRRCLAALVLSFVAGCGCNSVNMSSEVMVGERPTSASFIGARRDVPEAKGDVVAQLDIEREEILFLDVSNRSSVLAVSKLGVSLRGGTGPIAWSSCEPVVFGDFTPIHYTGYQKFVLRQFYHVASDGRICSEWQPMSIEEYIYIQDSSIGLIFCIRLVTLLQSTFGNYYRWARGESLSVLWYVGYFSCVFMLWLIVVAWVNRYRIDFPVTVQSDFGGQYNIGYVESDVLWWSARLREIWPNAVVNAREYRQQNWFAVEVKVRPRLDSGGSYVFTARSKNGFSDAWLSLAPVLPSSDWVRVQGIENVFGVPTSVSTRFIKSCVTFMYEFSFHRTPMQKAIKVLIWIDQLYDILLPSGLHQNLAAFREVIFNTPTMISTLASQVSQSVGVLFERDDGKIKPEQLERLREAIKKSRMHFDIMDCTRFVHHDDAVTEVNFYIPRFSFDPDSVKDADVKTTKIITRDELDTTVFRFWNMFCLERGFDLQAQGCEDNSMSRLNEYLQANKRPVIRRGDFIVKNCGPDHEPLFHVSLIFDGKLYEYAASPGEYKTHCMYIIADRILREQCADVRPQSLGEFASHVDMFLRGAFNSSSAKAAIKLFTLVWHVVFVFKKGEFSWEHINTWEKAMATTSGEAAMNLGSNVLDHIRTLATCSQEFFATRDASVFFRNDTEVAKFLETVEKLVIEVSNVPIQATLPDTIQDLERRIVLAITNGEVLRPKVKLALRPNFTSGLTQLRSIALKVSMMARTSTNRAAPFTLLLTGAPKIGKSSITNLLMAQFRVLNPKNKLAGNGLELHQGGVYTRTLKEEYWSAYMNSFWGIVYDDIGQTNPKCPEFAMEINEIIQVVNNAAFFPNMAGVEEKGNRYVAPQIVLANSNHRDLNANHAVRSPGAVLRRFPYVVTPTVRLEFQDEDGTLDAVKAREHFNLWNFKVEKVILRGNDRVEYETLHDSMETPEFLEWFNQVANDHYVRQGNNDVFQNTVRDARPCEHCGILKPLCRCAAPVDIHFAPMVNFFAQMSILWTVTFTIMYSWIQFLEFCVTIIHVFMNPVSWLKILYNHGFFCPGVRGTTFTVDADTVERFLWARGWIRTVAALNRRAVAAKAFVGRHRAIIGAIIVAISAVAFITWVHSMFKSLQPQSTDDEGVVPGGVPDKPLVDIENQWKTSKTPSYNMFLSQASQTCGTDHFIKVVSQAMGVLSKEGDSKSIKVLNVFGQFWLIPLHYIRSLKEKKTKVLLTRSLCYAGGDQFGSVSFILDIDTVRVCPENDFALIHIPAPPGKDITPLMARMPKDKLFEGSLALTRQESGVAMFPFSATKYRGPLMIQSLSALNGLSAYQSYEMFTYRSEVETMNGDCGSPVLICGRAMNCIVGFHVGVGLDSVEKVALLPPIDWLKKEMAENQSCVVQGETNFETLAGGQIKMDPKVHPKCPLNFEGMVNALGASVLPIGRLLGLPMNSFKSMVKRNKFAEFWESKGYSTTKIRPHTGKDGCPSWLPKRNFLLNAVKQKDNLNSDKLAEAIAHYKQRLISRLPEKEIQRLKPVSEEVNLYGLAGDNFINAMEFDTGAGFPHCKPKCKVMESTQHERFPNGTYKLTEPLKKRILRMEKDMSEGVRPGIIFNASLKDEPVSAAKLLLGKIRVFQAICLEGLFLLRKFFLTIIALFQNWNFISEAAIGMDATGPDWDDIHDYIFLDGWKIFCGDYSNYDQSMGAVVMLGAWSILLDLAKMSANFDVKALKIMWVLAMECCYPIINFFGDLLLLNGTNPSGHGLTVVINSMVNSIYMRYAWLTIVGSLEDFEDNVRVMTYGDDNIISVSPKYQEIFNQVTVTKVLFDVGIGYTDAKKTGDAARPFCEPSEISFLKRGFVKSEHGFWCAPLEMASIHKMLIIGVDSGKVQENDRLVSVLLSSHLEAFQHGRVFFEEHQGYVKQCVELFALQGWLAAKGGLPPYELLLERRLAKVSRKSLLSKAYASA